MTGYSRIVLTCWISAAISLCGEGVNAASDDNLRVPPELWDRPRTGRTIMTVPAVRQAIHALLINPEVKLTLRHPPGPEATTQAEELRAWLVAHAVEPARIALRADLQARQPLQFEVGR